MSTALCALIAVLFLFGVTLGMLTVLVLGIRTDDRRRNLRGSPRTRAESASRCLLLGVRNPDPGNSETGED